MLVKTNKLHEFKRLNKGCMIRRITDINQVLDVLDNERATFYKGRSNTKEEVKREEVGKMKPYEINRLIKEGLIVKINRT